MQRCCAYRQLLRNRQGYDEYLIHATLLLHSDNFFAIDKAVSGIITDGTDVELMAHMSLEVTWRSSYEELVSTQSALREEARKGSVPPSYISPRSGHCQYTGTQYEGTCCTLCPAS
jgi:hypothetical protein